MYSINNIALSNFGITPGQITASNLAVSGMLDMPARIGKVYHDWTGEAGVEPYVLASEIRHGSRTITFNGFMVGEDKSSVYAMLANFYKELDSYKELVPLVTPWSSHQVYIKEPSEVKYLDHGWIALQLEFEEPIVPNVGIINIGAEALKPNIDGVAFKDLGMFLTAFNNHLNRPKIKEQQFTFYQTQGYQITPAEALEFELEIIAHAPTFEVLKQNIASLQAALSASGMRTIKIDESIREVFNVKGFEVSNLKVANGISLCKIKLPLMMSQVGEPLEILDLTDITDSEFVNNLLELIKIN